MKALILKEPVGLNAEGFSHAEKNRKGRKICLRFHFKTLPVFIRDVRPFSCFLLG